MTENQITDSPENPLVSGRARPGSLSRNKTQKRNCPRGRSAAWPRQELAGPLNVPRRNTPEHAWGLSCLCSSVNMTGTGRLEGHRLKLTHRNQVLKVFLMVHVLNLDVTSDVMCVHTCDPWNPNKSSPPDRALPRAQGLCYSLAIVIAWHRAGPNKLL